MPPDDPSARVYLIVYSVGRIDEKKRKNFAKLLLRVYDGISDT